MNTHHIQNEIDIWHIAIPVSDLEKSIGFYCNVMGLKLIGRDEYPSKKQAFVSVYEGGFTIELFEPKGDATTQPAKRPDHLAFECKEISRFHSKLSLALSGDAPEIVEFDNGVKYLGLKDPDGVSIEIFQGRAIYEKSILGTA